MGLSVTSCLQNLTHSILVIVYFSECKCAVACVCALLFYASPLPRAHGNLAPPPLKLGTVGPMSRCFGIQQAQVQDHQSLEEEGITNTWKATP